jgi:hypothetical protein
VRESQPDPKPERDTGSQSDPESVDDCEVEVDEVVRLAVGVGIDVLVGEVCIRAISTDERGGWDRPPEEARAPRIWWGRALQRMLPTVNVMAAVKVGELTLAEQNAVVLEALTLDALAVKSGDEVKLTSVKKRPKEAGNGYEVVRVTKTVKAYAEDEYVRQNRGRRQKGTLPRVLIGESLRVQLGVVPTLDPNAAEKEFYDSTWASGAVLVSPSRRFVFVDHFREAALVAAFGLVGVAVGIDDPFWLKASVLVSAVVVPLALIMWRIRTRLR